MKITLLTGQTYKIEQQFDFPIKVSKSSRAKRLTLRIDSKERISVLTLPRYCSQKRAIDFVEKNQDWIRDSLSKIPETRSFQDGEIISLFGKKVTIRHRPKLRSGVRLEKDQLLVSGSLEFLHRRVKDYIRQQAQNEFYRRSVFYADKLNQHINHITIKDTKSRWGSCSTLNNINYSWRIALAPDYVIEYLMAHEVSHLDHPNHSQDFWNCVENLYPGYEKGETWLKEHGKELYIYA